MSQIPRPRGLICSHQTGSAFLTLPDAEDLEQETQYRLPHGDWQPATHQGHRWRVPTRELTVTDFRARYYAIVDEQPVYGPWASGQVWTTKGFREDDEVPAPEPARPEEADHRWTTPTKVEIRWAQSGTVDGWSVTYTIDGHPTQTVQVTEPAMTVTDVPLTCSLDIQIRAVKNNRTSPPLTLLLPDAMDLGALPAPKNVLVAPGPSTLEVTWTREGVYGEWWLEWIETTSDVADTERGHGTPVPSTGVIVHAEPRHLIEGLNPGTDYLIIVATRYRGTQSRGTPVRATTLDDGGTRPRTPRLRPGTITASSVEVLWDDDPNATGWLVRRLPGQPRHLPASEPRWTASGLIDGQEYLFGVIAVNEATGVESGEALITLAPRGPQPMQRPSPVTNLHATDIVAHGASMAWNDSDDPADLYRVGLSGETELVEEVIGTSVELRGLLPERTYTASVTAVRDNIESAAQQVVFTTLAADASHQADVDGALPAPSALTVASPHPALIDVAWDAAPEAGTWWLISVDGRTWTRRGEPNATLVVQPGVQHTVELYAALDDGLGKPARLSPVVARGVVTAAHSAPEDNQDDEQPEGNRD